jgi:hypothetical protein
MLPVRRRTGAMSNQKRKADGHVEDLSSIAVESESRPTSALWATLPRSTNGLHPATKPGKSSASQSGSGRDQRFRSVNDEASIDVYGSTRGLHITTVQLQTLNYLTRRRCLRARNAHYHKQRPAAVVPFQVYTTLTDFWSRRQSPKAYR